jgi:O-antigen polymerase
LLPVSLHVMVELPFYLSSFHWFLWLILLYMPFSHFEVSYANRLSASARKAVPVLGLLLASIVTVFSVHSLLSLRGLAQFVSEAGKDLSRLDTISRNPALSEEGLVLLMRRLLYADLARGEHRHTGRYIAWAEKYIQHTPDNLVLMDLSFAYEHAGEGEKARDIIDRAVAIFNKNEDVAACKRYIDKGRGIEYFRLVRTRRTPRPVSSK